MLSFAKINKACSSRNAALDSALAVVLAYFDISRDCSPSAMPTSTSSLLPTVSDIAEFNLQFAELVSSW